ncbi:MAG: endonuclease [Phycisphaerae bacterium]|nr:endonuclease [Phycisphaerae bacterium]
MAGLRRSGIGYILIGLVFALLHASAFAQYDPPPGYYDTATGTGTVLKQQLHDIIDNHIVRSYDSARQSLALLDQDPDNLSNIILIYNGASVSGTWDSGATWDREHQWPRSLGVGDSGADTSDCFNLHSCNPSINSSRGNKPYGIGSGYWDPAALASPPTNDRGDCARAMFYMTVRYDGSDANTTDLELVNGFPGANQMGDLAKLLEWHYSDPVNDIERRRNHLIWSSADNPLYFQGNRNPFIDHPEFVWAIWGTTPNDSTLYVGSTMPGDGQSMETVEYRLLIDATPSPVNVTLHKAGTTPTTYDVIVSGNVTTDAEGTGETVVSGTQNRTITVNLVSTAVVGPADGTITIDNTDLTSAGTGKGDLDMDDVIEVTADVLDHAEASFDAGTDDNTLTLDFGGVPAGSGLHQLNFGIHNLEVTAGFTAALDVDSISPSGDTAELSTNLAPVANIPAGGAQFFTATLDGDAAPGAYSTTFVIAVSDENIPGAAPGTSLTLTLTGEILADGVPAASTWGLAALALLVLCAGTIVLLDRSHLGFRV